MYSKRFFSFVFLVFVLHLSNAQDLQLSFHHLTEENGLTHSDKYFISKDSKGFVWIGTEDGLLRFDGFQIVKYQNEVTIPYSLEENVITSKCFEDDGGNLWFTTSNAIVCYRRKKDEFTSFSYAERLGNYNAFYLDHEYKLWLRIGGSDSGALYSFDIVNKSFEQHISLQGEEFTPVSNQEGKLTHVICTALSNKPGLIYTDLATSNTELVEFLKTSDGEKLYFSSPTRSVYVDSDTIVWVGAYNGLGKYEMGGVSGVLESKRSASIEEDIGYVFDVVEYDTDYLLVAAHSGLFLFDKNSQSFVQKIQYDSNDPYSLSLKAPNNIEIDDAGTIWLSGSHQEIAYSSRWKHRFPNIKNTVGSFVTSLAEDHHGNIWCSTLDSGTYVYNQQKELILHSKKLKNATHREGYSELRPIEFFISNEDNQWWGNLQSTYLFWNDINRMFEFDMAYFLGVGGMSSAQINYNYCLSNGKNLIAKGSEVFELQLTQEAVDTVFWHTIKHLQLQTINMIYEDQNGHIYLGDDQGRLVILKEENDHMLKIADLQDVGIVSAIREDTLRDMVWVTSSKGLGQIDPITFKYHLYTESEDHIPNEAINGIALDESGQLWLPSNNGLIRYVPETKDFHRFGISDGLLSPVFNKKACLIASQTGEIWVGGKNGVNVFNPDGIHLMDSRPNVQLSRVLINDETYKTKDNLNEQKNLSLSYEQNTLSFEFVALDYSDPSANRFRCQLIGYDQEPIDLGTRNFIRYGNVPAGNYSLSVWGSNSDGVFNEEPFEMNVEIIPPFYQTWWFYLLVTLAIAGILYSIFKYRLEQALKVERLRVKISSDLHDDVGGILSGLAMQTELLERTIDESAKPKLKRIGELSRSAMSRMRDTVWAIDARKDKLENLVDRINEHAEETLIPQHMDYNVQVVNVDLGTNVPTDIRQNLYLICKEAITNTAKHSNGDHLDIILEKSGNDFVMRIADNGKVIAKNYKTTGQGLSNMTMRAKQIKARITTSIEDGYEIVLTCKSF